ncbi:PIN-like domain-containing protein [Streptomyces sp. NPDC096080]|uniref:PIN-like domain-containing protein n=1 Tax=Streptomyces sp. NPDC096080 TaxID=3156693 RepID=UPI003324C930
MAQGDPGTESSPGHDLMERFHAWLPSAQADEERFFTQALVVLDANVLLTLYDVTSESRDVVLDALEKVSDRLWLPHQAGLEFIRNRRSRVESRRSQFATVKQNIDRRFTDASQQLIQIRRQVQQFIEKHSGDEQAQRNLEDVITRENILDLDVVQEWKQALLDEVKKLQDAYDLDPNQLDDGDPLLDRIATLIGDRIGTPLPHEALGELVGSAVGFRFPNRIPPGFADSSGGHDKETDLRRAGDYLIWEEIVRKACTLPEPQLVLLVTDDVKDDWWAKDRRGNPTHALPELADELWHRAGARLRLETTQRFLDGASAHLGISLTDDTVAELVRVSSEQKDSASRLAPSTADESTRATRQAWLDKAFAVCGFDHPETRNALNSVLQFADWLLTVTADLTLRERGSDEPVVDARAVILAEGPRDGQPPAPDWQLVRMPVGGGIRYVWTAPWLTELIDALPSYDDSRLRKLAGRHAAHLGEAGDAGQGW